MLADGVRSEEERVAENKRKLLMRRSGRVKWRDEVMEEVEDVLKEVGDVVEEVEDRTWWRWMGLWRRRLGAITERVVSPLPRASPPVYCSSNTI